MKITPIPFKVSLGRDASRSQGLHLTDITSNIALATGKLKAEYKDRDIEESSGVYRVAAGLAWEEWIAPQHTDVLFHPGEISKDGIAMSPDGVSFLNISKSQPIAVLHEFKFTWKSMRRESDLSGEWMWMAQMMAYCHALGTNIAELHVYWANGDYRNSGPQYKIYRIEFTDREIRENWASIINNKPLRRDL